MKIKLILTLIFVASSLNMNGSSAAVDVKAGMEPQASAQSGKKEVTPEMIKQIIKEIYDDSHRKPGNLVIVKGGLFGYDNSPKYTSEEARQKKIDELLKRNIELEEILSAAQSYRVKLGELDWFKVKERYQNDLRVATDNFIKTLQDLISTQYDKEKKSAIDYLTTIGMPRDMLDVTLGWQYLDSKKEDPSQLKTYIKSEMNSKIQSPNWIRWKLISIKKAIDANDLLSLELAINDKMRHFNYLLLYDQLDYTPLRYAIYVKNDAAVNLLIKLINQQIISQKQNLLIRDTQKEIEALQNELEYAKKHGYDVGEIPTPQPSIQ